MLNTTFFVVGNYSTEWISKVKNHIWHNVKFKAGIAEFRKIK